MRPHPPTSEILVDAFRSIKERNAAYSTRAFARDLGISQTYVSLLMNGKKKLSLQRAIQIGATLGLDDVKSQALISDTGHVLAGRILSRSERPKADTFIRLESDRYKTLSHWYHIAILDLTTLTRFRPDPAWIARQLRINVSDASDAIDRLLRLGLLVRKNGMLKKTQRMIAMPTHRSELAIQTLHRQMILKALDAFAATGEKDFAAREISGVTMSVNSSRIAEAKKRVSRFKREIAAFLTEGECDALYQMNVQLYPIVSAPRSSS